MHLSFRRLGSNTGALIWLNCVCETDRVLNVPTIGLSHMTFCRPMCQFFRRWLGHQLTDGSMAFDTSGIFVINIFLSSRFFVDNQPISLTSGISVVNTSLTSGFFIDNTTLISGGIFVIKKLQTSGILVDNKSLSSGYFVDNQPLTSGIFMVNQSLSSIFLVDNKTLISDISQRVNK